MCNRTFGILLWEFLTVHVVGDVELIATCGGLWIVLSPPSIELIITQQWGGRGRYSAATACNIRHHFVFHQCPIRRWDRTWWRGSNPGFESGASPTYNKLLVPGVGGIRKKFHFLVRALEYGIFFRSFVRWWDCPVKEALWSELIIGDLFSPLFPNIFLK